MGSRYLDDDVSLLLLGVNVGIEVGLAGLNGLLDRLDRVSALLVVTLHLPVELGLGGDVDVDAEVHERVNAVIIEGVETLIRE